MRRRNGSRTYLEVSQRVVLGVLGICGETVWGSRFFALRVRHPTFSNASILAAEGLLFALFAYRVSDGNLLFFA